MGSIDWTKWIEWLFYNAVIPLAPVAIVKFFSWILNKPRGNTLTIFAIIRDGQAFFYCTALAAVAIGDLKRVPPGFKTAPWVMGLLLILILSTGAFAAGAISKDSLEETRFGWASVATVAASIAIVIAFREKAGLL